MDEKSGPTRKEKVTIMFANFRTFLYNKDKGEVMGRTADSWAKLSLFFLIYYACLAAFFAAMFAIAFSTMPETKDGPKYTSILGDRPVLLVYPKNVGSYDKNNLEGIKKDYLNFLKAYNDTQCYSKEPCAPDGDYRPKDAVKQCTFKYSTLGPCAPDGNSTFGYKTGSPCLYLRLTKTYGWKPNPKGIEKAVKLDCYVKDETTKIPCYPDCPKAFPISFWPFRGETSFRTPIAAIQVPHRKQKVTVRCKAIADNIELSGNTFRPGKGAYGQIEFTVEPAAN